MAFINAESSMAFINTEAKTVPVTVQTVQRFRR